MKQDVFGNIMYEGKLINIENTDEEKLKEITTKLKEKNKRLEEKIEKIYKQ